MEAYYGRTGPASRAYRGSGDITMTLYGDVGRALIYGVHAKWLFNIVAHKPHRCGGVLIGALEPLKGIEIMKNFRKTDNLFQLANGPGRLTEAMVINKSLHKKLVYLKNSKITIKEGRKEENIARSFRIGGKKDLDIPLRFYLKGCRSISARKKTMGEDPEEQVP
jgi:DNA-3-methyladenine glycosylase